MSAIVSVLCPSFNHEKYVNFFIESLLAQTNKNWELIIVDDCSCDGNVSKIKKFKDKRIKFIQHNFNKGINCALTEAFNNASGKYISLCASDDMLMPDYIQNVIDTFKNNNDKGIIFCDLQQMDESGKILPGDILHNFKKNRYQALRYLFMNGNCMLSPGMSVKKDLFEKIIPLDIPLSQYQDYKISIDLLLLSDFVVMDKVSVVYRKPSKKSGISVFNDKTIRMRQLEENILMNSFLKICDIKMLYDIFGDDMKQFGKINKNIIPFVLGKLALESDMEYKNIWGYNQIVNFISDYKNYKLLNKLYGFNYADFLKLSTYIKENPVNKKYRKYKKLFNIFSVCLILSILIIIVMAIK